MNKGQMEFAVMFGALAVIMGIIALVVVDDVMKPYYQSFSVVNESDTVTTDTWKSLGKYRVITPTTQVVVTNKTNGIPMGEACYTIRTVPAAINVTCANHTAVNVTYTGAGQSYVGGTSNVLYTNIPVLMALGLLALGAGWVFLR